jgi:hypothetical protein
VCNCWYHYFIHSITERIMDHIRHKYISLNKTYEYIGHKYISWNKTYEYINDSCLIFMFTIKRILTTLPLHWNPIRRLCYYSPIPTHKITTWYSLPLSKWPTTEYQSPGSSTHSKDPQYPLKRRLGGPGLNFLKILKFLGPAGIRIPDRPTLLRFPGYSPWSNAWIL